MSKSPDINIVELLVSQINAIVQALIYETSAIVQPGQSESDRLQLERSIYLSLEKTYAGKAKLAAGIARAEAAERKALKKKNESSGRRGRRAL